jgi:WD40 repeat protein
VRIEYTEYGFITKIENSYVDKVLCKYDESCTVYFYDRPSKELKVRCSSYNSQFGLPVSEDGRLLFVSSWEEGLFTYDIMSGAILWHLKDKKITSIVVYPSYIITQKFGASIIKLDINNGKILGEIKSGTIEMQFPLSGSYILVNSIKGKLSVVDTDKMLVAKNYSTKIVNPLDCLSLLIQDAQIQNEALMISGIEDYPNKRCESSSPKPFVRAIDSNFWSG